MMTANHPGSPLLGITYGRRAHDLSRFVSDPADEAIATIVRAASLSSIEERDTLRALLDPDDCDVLLTFAQRRSVSGIRNGSLEEALDAIGALTLVTAAKVDYRDLSVDFPLYAVRRLGGNVAETVESGAATSERGTRGAFTARRGAHVTLKQCMLLEVTSTYGLGFMDMLSGRYSPQADLAGCAVRMADRLDADGGYVVEGLHVSMLSAWWFDHAPKRNQDIRTSGCISVSASTMDGSPLGQALLVFLAEVDRATAASSLVARAEAASTRGRPRVAGSDGRLVLIVIGGASSNLGREPPETKASLGPIRDGLLRELRH